MCSNVFFIFQIPEGYLESMGANTTPPPPNETLTYVYMGLDEHGQVEQTHLVLQ